ncbi:MAG TPA: hypothetical protein VHL30_01095 [Chlamydiales bacterium]|jgi:hypothetical protein|nr:hypothetical protein [Chlamydiales bacterium]
MRFIPILCFLFSACGPSSASDLRVVGEAETGKLAALLHNIDTKDDLQRNLPKVRKSYLRIAEIVLQVRKFPEAINTEPSTASDQLFTELARLYEMPGCRALMESAQDEALALLNR